MSFCDTHFVEPSLKFKKEITLARCKRRSGHVLYIFYKCAWTNIFCRYVEEKRESSGVYALYVFCES